MDARRAPGVVREGWRSKRREKEEEGIKVRGIKGEFTCH